MRQNRALRTVLLVGFLGSSGCAGPIEDQMGPQVFHEPNIGPAGGSDKEIQSAVQAAVDVAQGLKFRYDASSSADGRVVVTALWQSHPVTLTMRFFRNEGSIFIASKRTDSGDVFLTGGGEKLEQLYYSRLSAEAGRRGLRIFGDPSPTSHL